ncbi:GAF domain-containing sensor histidine kinase [Methanohalophilus mahii]|uniref:histidine kinase n=1 Tax=Methanohalophilus mahii (strain ATCC 35705 / DSM 5219 / SLP) TaxID=547558 RepID=D5E978_METMS|nr:ATP-binding protein [Methanohalophilus mahii]ADE35729.1 GAF sensor signal transduction histidine kinase [Methanohalophilus mahii DSM 5219]
MAFIENQCSIQAQLDKNINFDLNTQQSQQKAFTREAIKILSSLFTELDNFDERIEKSLLILGTLTQASRAHLFLFNNEEMIMDNTHEWCADGVLPKKDLLQGLSMNRLQWLMGKMRKGEIIHINDVNSLSEVAQNEKEILLTENVKSIILFPLVNGNKVVGFVSLANTTYNDVGEKNDTEALKTMIDIMGQFFKEREYKKQLNAKIKIQKTVNNVQSILINHYDSDEAFVSVLQEVSKLTKATHSYLFQFRNGENIADMTHEWCAESMPSHREKLHNLNSGKFHWFTGRLKRNEVIQIVDPNRLPPEAAAEKKLLQTLGIKSLIAFPIWGEKKLAGFLTINNTERIARWDQNDIYMLLVIADSVGAVIKKEKANKAFLRAKSLEEDVKTTKTEFIATMSHELRTPLNAIIGFSQLLSSNRYGNMNEKELKYSFSILKGGKHLLNLINDILDFSKIHSNKMELNIETINLKEICDEIKTFITPLATKKGITVEYNNKFDIDINLDKLKFIQIMSNLLSNAVKFTPDKGKVSVDIDFVAEYVQVSVTDSGIGIPEHKLNMIFDPFIQADSSNTRKYGGTGLGLALVKEYVEMHGGTIWVESELGKGSTFTFTIPVNDNDFVND